MKNILKIIYKKVAQNQKCLIFVRQKQIIMKYVLYAKCPNTGNMTVRAWGQTKEAVDKLASEMLYYTPVIIADLLPDRTKEKEQYN